MRNGASGPIKSLDSQLALNMLNASVLSALLTYFSSDGSYSDMDKLHKLQKGAAVVITGSNYDIRSTEIFDQLDGDD